MAAAGSWKEVHPNSISCSSFLALVGLGPSNGRVALPQAAGLSHRYCNVCTLLLFPETCITGPRKQRHQPPEIDRYTRIRL